MPDEAAQGMQVTLSAGLQPVADECLMRVELLDLSCDPQQVAPELWEIPCSAEAGALGCRARRVLAVRAVLGQLVSGDGSKADRESGGGLRRAADRRPGVLPVSVRATVGAGRSAGD